MGNIGCLWDKTTFSFLFAVMWGILMLYSTTSLWQKPQMSRLSDERLYVHFGVWFIRDLKVFLFKCLYTSISFCVHIYKPEKYQYLDPILVSAWRWEVIVRLLYWWTCWPSLFQLFVHKINDRQDSIFFLKLHCQD